MQQVSILAEKIVLVCYLAMMSASSNTFVYIYIYIQGVSRL